MAQKRMFDKRIVESDKFTDLPNSSKALYFMAGMSADDRGFFQPRRLQKTNGFTDDDFKILIAKGYFIPFESGVMVITDWNKNNWLDKRRITETEYVDELKMLSLINEKYELENTCLASAKQTLSENRIEENRIEENRIDNIYDKYENEIGSLSPRQFEILKDYQSKLNDDMIINAIERTCDSGVKTFNYLKAILNNWVNNGYKTLGDIKDNKKKSKVPHWLNEEIDDEKLSEEEVNEMKKELGII